MNETRLRAGVFRTPGVVQRLKAAATVNAAGHIVEPTSGNWENYCTRWFQMESISARESLTGDQQTANITTILRTRYDSVSAGIDTKMQVKIGSRTFNIAKPPVDIDNRHLVVEFPVIEVK